MDETQGDLGATKAAPGSAASDQIFRLPPSLSDHLSLDDKLGEGAMGVVYQGTDLRTGERRAIKVARPGAHDLVRRRMIDEGRLMMRIRHPNVVSVVEMTDDPAEPILVCEFVPGGTLRERLDRHERIPFPEAMRLADGLLAGLQAIHEQGVVHRDLKPANVLLTATGDVKISDLGVAKQWGDEGSGLTAVGQLIGTPHYMAPEQLRGEAAAFSSDLYAVGVMLYEMITGRLPYEGESLRELLASVEAGVVRPIFEFNQSVPAELSQAVEKALSRHAADRPVSAETFRSELRARARRMTRRLAAIAATPETPITDSGSPREDRPGRAAPRPAALGPPVPGPGVDDVNLGRIRAFALVAMALVLGLTAQQQMGPVKPNRPPTVAPSVEKRAASLERRTSGEPRAGIWHVSRVGRGFWLSPGPLMVISRGAVKEQIQSLSDGLSRSPDDIDAICNLAHIQLRHGDKAEAVKALAQGLKRHPGNVALRNDLALTHLVCGHAVLSLAEFDLAIRDDSTVGVIHANRADALIQDHQVAAAKGELETAARLDSARAGEYERKNSKLMVQSRSTSYQPRHHGRKRR